MRGRVLAIALLAAVSGHPVQPSAGRVVVAPVNVDLAPSPYEPALAPNPFDSPAPPPAPARRPRRAATKTRELAPSPYELALLPNPYGGPSSPSALAASGTVGDHGNERPRALAPSPYARLPREVAPLPY